MHRNPSKVLINADQILRLHVHATKFNDHREFLFRGNKCFQRVTAFVGRIVGWGWLDGCHENCGLVSSDIGGTAGARNQISFSCAIEGGGGSCTHSHSRMNRFLRSWPSSVKQTLQFGPHATVFQQQKVRRNLLTRTLSWESWISTPVAQKPGEVVLNTKRKTCARRTV